MEEDTQGKVILSPTKCHCAIRIMNKASASAATTFRIEVMCTMLRCNVLPLIEPRNDSTLVVTLLFFVRFESHTNSFRDSKPIKLPHFFFLTLFTHRTFQVLSP